MLHDFQTLKWRLEPNSAQSASTDVALSLRADHEVLLYFTILVVLLCEAAQWIMGPSNGKQCKMCVTVARKDVLNVTFAGKNLLNANLVLR